MTATPPPKDVRPAHYCAQCQAPYWWVMADDYRVIPAEIDPTTGALTDRPHRCGAAED